MKGAAEPPPHEDPLLAAARELGQHHRVTSGSPRTVPVLERLDSISAWIGKLDKACAKAEPEHTKAAEWLLDNKYRIKRAVTQIEEDLPHAFYRRLPPLEDPEQLALPRVFCVARSFLADTRIQISLFDLVQFVQSYQQETPLTIAELWALPTMLRLICLETLITASASLFPQLEPPFEERICACILELHEPTECIARSLSGLRIVSSISWKDFFDRTSLVERLLQNDPLQIYGRMDFDTRDRYRKAVEDLARYSDQTEWQIVERVLERAGSAAAARLRGHVGHWLLGEGRATIESAVGYRPTWGASARRWLLNHAGFSYAAALVSVALAALFVPAWYLLALDATLPALIAGMVLCLVPASILGITIVHWAVTNLVPPRLLPKLDFEKGIAADFRTVVVVPVIVGEPEEVSAHMERLELHWLANPDPLVCYALLSDPRDARTERLPDDEAVEQALLDGIRKLNARHGVDGSGPFLLLHRTRRFNPAENCWMAWERKRGKLEQFNRLVLGAPADDFPLREGDTERLRGSRFVVTVDADTVLPPGAVARLAGTLAHPLNEPEIDPASDRLRAGYTVIQPRVEISPISGNRSLFSYAYAGDAAIDIYSRAVSNVYQDLFGSAVYVGKAIYDVAAFQRCLDSRVAENALLSHDLFEGAHGRVALASDIVLYDNYPSSYVEYMRRWHRWVRGDWQLLPWLFRRVPAANGVRIRNELSGLDRWKIFDNLRRSIIPPALVALAVAGWLALPGNPWVWTVLTIAAPGAYLFTDAITGLAHGRRRGVFQSTFRAFRAHAGHWLLALVFLLQDAVVSLNAIGRTLWRLFVSRSGLLEWTSAAHTAKRIASDDLRGIAWRVMWPATAIAALLTVTVSLVNPAALPPAGLLLLAWLAAPEIAAWISRPRPPFVERLEAKDRAFLRGIARRTWLFFERFVGPEDSWLPPDNYQEDPQPDVAHRTSPTNIGMYLLSGLTSWDLGYVGSTDLAVRVEDTLNTLGRLEHYRGHLLNWYDTRNLTPLEPRYVSTVDSGNLAVCLITLKEGCLGAADAPAILPCRWDGLTDTLNQLMTALEQLSGGLSDALSQPFQAMMDCAARVRDRPGEWRAAIAQASGTWMPDLSAAIANAVATQGQSASVALNAIQVWLERANRHLARMQADLETLFPWIGHCESPPEACRELAGRIIESASPQRSLAEAASLWADTSDWLQEYTEATAGNADAARWLAELAGLIQQGAQAQRELRLLLLDVAARAEAVAYAMDFTLLYEAETRLFHIGYNVSSDRPDPHFYDLLASEARLASYFAIAKRDVPVEHWFFLGRPVTRLAGEPSLLSWNGSMFEYLMPSLLLRSSAGTLLAHSERSAVDIQRRYARQLGMPWGVSESGYAARDSGRRYQYQAFGVPGLGLRRGLAQDLVVTPYATALALAVYPASAVRNLEQLARLGITGLYGFMEAVDFTPQRIPSGRNHSPIRAYMAHHQGMILAAIGNALNDDIHVRRFSADMRMRTSNLLLQERVPTELPPELVSAEEPVRIRISAPAKPAPYPWRPRLADRWPQMHLLGNGRFATWISEAGGGALWWHEHALTRWSPAAAGDDAGQWIYVHDQDSDALWSVGRQPAADVDGDADVIFHPHMVEFHRRDHGVAIRMEVAVAPGDDLEIRRIVFVNETGRTRNLCITSYAEVVLAPPRDHERHPAFSKLFVGSEYIPPLSGLLFTRRPRHAAGRPPTLFHRVIRDDRERANPRYETDRGAFFGRTSGPRRPRGAAGRLTGTVGWTLDPVMALQFDLVLEPWETRQFAFLTMAAGSRESVLELAERYATLASVDWALQDAAREAAHEAQELDLDPGRFPEFQSLASLLAVPRTAWHETAPRPHDSRLGQPRLWALGLSGDLPVLVVRMNDPRDTDLLRAILGAHRLWRLRLLHVDLVILRMGVGGYEEPVRERALKLIQEAGLQDMVGRNGGIHLLFADHLAEDDRMFLEATASAVLEDSGGSLERQIDTGLEPSRVQPLFEPTKIPEAVPMEPLARPTDLQFENDFGGFTADGKEYVIHLGAGESTPAPWCNVLANDELGCVTSESGGGFTWALNSGENRLTPWSNDPVLDPPGEALYLRDEETAEIWSPTPAPAGAATAHQVRHGAGYTQWQSHSHGFEHELLVFVARRDPVKIARLRLRNVMPSARRITVTYYAEWLLGALRSISGRHVNSCYDADSRALLADNAWNPDFSSRVAFLASSHPPHSITTDRRDFIGRAGDLNRPAGLRHWDLRGRTTTNSEPCAAFQVHLDVAAGDSAEVVFVLGQGRDLAHAKALLEFWRRPGAPDRAFEDLRAHWDRLLGAVQAQTPDPAFDLMVNRWLLYQTLASRILARAGFYQAGGAIGFRDQLQDVLALLHCDSSRARAHILNCAGRQFEEGDVLHWWHPPQGRGVRTHCSDDLLWLPYVTSRYVEATGDESILTEDVPFLHAPELAPEEGDRYGLFEAGAGRATLFHHCQRALERGVTQGAHRLPLIGTGDWNDGMNRVGALGRGESVWLGWFAIAAMNGFCDLAMRMNRQALADRWKARAEKLGGAIEQAGWDGHWYLRAFDDEGHPWGSARSDECRIDSIAQSWSVLSGAGDPDRAREALAAVEHELVRADERLIRLLWPPFHHTLRDPGYIKAYPPGVRENGGHYAHAAAWRGHALAALGDGDGAWRVFDLLNPIRHCETRTDLERYSAEPYVLAADIASVAPHVGRAGWTWYTGAAAWTWRLGVEGILGLRLQDGALLIEPCLPKSWGAAQVKIAGPRGNLAIAIEDPDHLGRGLAEITVDGTPIEAAQVAFPQDGSTRSVRVRLRQRSASRESASA